MKKYISLLLIFTMLFFNVVPAFAEESQFIDTYSIDVYGMGNNGQLGIYADLTTLPFVDKLEISLTLEKLTDYGWSPVTMFYGVNYNNIYAYISTTYKGELYATYRCVGTFTVTNGGVSESRVGYGLPAMAFTP